MAQSTETPKRPVSHVLFVKVIAALDYKVRPPFFFSSALRVAVFCVWLGQRWLVPANGAYLCFTMQVLLSGWYSHFAHLL